jgi:membrane protease YdiL (CAAX protease family)
MSTKAAVRLQIIELVEFSAFLIAFLAALAIRPDPSYPGPTMVSAFVAGLAAAVVAIALLERRLPWQGRKSEKRTERSLFASLGAGVATAVGLLLFETWLQPFVSEAPPMTPDAWLHNRLIEFGSIWLVGVAMFLVPPKRGEGSDVTAADLGDAQTEGRRFVWPGGRGSR